MDASIYINKFKDPEEWRRHAKALRRSASVLWDDFQEVLIAEVLEAKESGGTLTIEKHLKHLKLQNCYTVSHLKLR